MAGEKWLDFERFAVFGLGKSGVAAANLLARRGKAVTASDTRGEEALAEVRQILHPRVVVVSGKNLAGDAQVVVVSPGLPPTADVLVELDRKGIPLISEVELAFAAARAPFVAITGTDGKTTTTELVGAMFAGAGRAVEVAGNIGTALCDIVESVEPPGLIVAEISSFQLWSIHGFRPVAAAFTNIDADHLDYHGTRDEYVRCKRRLIENMDGGDWAVFNMEDPMIAAWSKGFKGKRAAYGLCPLPEGFELALWHDEGCFFAREGAGDAFIWCEDVAALPLKGRHNLLNMLCAAGLSRTQGVSWEDLTKALETFKPLAHRFERVRVAGEVVFYDDSKATNAHAALAGLRSLEGPFVPIVGGVDKGLDLGELASFLQDEAKAVVLIGQITVRLRGELSGAGMDSTRIVEAATMEQAVAEAMRLLGDKGAVVLSPACSSFDMFESYAHRGRAYQAAVKDCLALDE